MMDRYDKHKSRGNRATIRELLMREWDPIGVAACPKRRTNTTATSPKHM